MNATEMMKSFPEKRMHNFTRNKTTLEYVNALHENMGVTPISVTADSQLIKVKQGGSDQGTWFQENLAIYFAQWLSPQFGVWCNQRIEEIMNKGFSAATPEATDYIETPMGTEVRVMSKFLSVIVGSDKLILYRA